MSTGGEEVEQNGPPAIPVSAFLIHGDSASHWTPLVFRGSALNGDSLRSDVDVKGDSQSRRQAAERIQ